MRPFWSGRTMLCAPEDPGAGAGGDPPKKHDPPPKNDPPVADGRNERAVMDDLARLDGVVKRLTKHVGLDEDEEEEPVPEKKKKGKKGEEELSTRGEASLDDILAGDFSLGGGDEGGKKDDEDEDEE